MYKILLHFTIFTCLLGLTGCGKNFFKRADVKDVPINVEERVQKNLEEGKGIRFGKFGKSSGGTFDFASSNEMWRATILKKAAFLEKNKVEKIVKENKKKTHKK